MNNRRNIFKDIDTADNWLTNHLLKNHNPTTHRILNTTKLTELIYSGFSLDETFMNIDMPEYPVNAEELSADLFGALFSPVLKRKDYTSIHLRERLFNKPIFERAVSDDRFDTLKKLCEDKELTSYYAALAFARTLQNGLIDKPYTPKANYLDIIKKLSEQLDTAINEIRKCKLDPKTYEPKKMLFLYNRVKQKLSQIGDLQVKLHVDAICYINSIGDEINAALESAVEAAIETHSIITAWGSDSGEMKNIPANRDLINHVKNSSELLEIAKSLGRYREIVADKRKNGYAYGLGEKYDLTTGNDITNCLSSELALLGTPETKILFMRKYEQKRLLQYRKRTQIIKGKGDAIFLVDESTSTRSVTAWAKAFALALLDISAKDKRKLAIVHFASANSIKTDLFEPGHYKSEDVMRAAEHFWGGGTNFEAPFKEALKLMEQGYENADITIITDGECKMSDDFCEELHNKLQKYGATVTGILLDKVTPCGESLEPFCDKIYHSKDITEDEIAVRILNQKAS